VVAPSVEEEDRRRICRERQVLIDERTSHVNRLKGLLFAQGIFDYAPLRRDRRARLQELRTGDGRALAEHVKTQISRELDRLELLLKQIKAVEAERDAMIAAMGKADGKTGAPHPLAMLLTTKGIGAEFAAFLWSEAFYRSFANRRQVAAFAGLVPTPWQSGAVAHEQGVSKSGNGRLRSKLIQLAWLWLRHQPQSALARWFHAQGQSGRKGWRKGAIVALARKLLVALWKYVSAGVAIEGAVMKTAA
jgi:transposase